MPVQIFEAREKLDKSTLKLVRCTIQKRLSSVLSYAHYVSRQLHRYGIHGNVYTSMDILPDGFRIVVEYHIVTLDEDVLRKFRGQLYQTSYDYKGPLNIYRKIERLISEGKVEESGEEGEEVEVVERGGEAGDTAQAGKGSKEEGGEGGDEPGRIDPLSFS